MNHKNFLTLSLIAGTLAACTPYQQQGAGVGALGGAALGAIAGDDSGDVVRGAAIGAAAGTGVAAYTERQRNQNNNYGRDYNNRYETQGRGGFDSQPQAPRQPTRNDYPSAQRTANPNQVLSPYEPYNVIDVEGFRTGQLAKDPSNGQIFRVP